MSNTTTDFRKDGDNKNDDSVSLFLAMVTPSKKKGRFSDKEGHTDLLNKYNKMNIKEIKINSSFL